MAAAAPSAELDETAIARVLAFVNIPKARECCRDWSRYIYASLQLEHLISFHKLVNEKGRVIYHHSAVRAMGQDFEECVAYQFEFVDSKTYHLDWNRSFGQWSAANERQIGSWQVMGDRVRCTSSKGPDTEDGCVRYAPAGRTFEIPVADVLSGHTMGDNDNAPTWEYQVRGAPVPENMQILNKTDLDDPHAPVRVHGEDARFVEIDGDVHEVSGDIVANYPESEWERLMRCRVRFGLT